MSRIVVVGSSYICNKGGTLVITQGNLNLKSDGKPVVDSSCKAFVPIPTPCLKDPSKPIPCVPIITEWKQADKSVEIKGKNIITENCTAECSIGGEISFLKGNNFKNVSIK